jgi:hypothetical protein
VGGFCLADGHEGFDLGVCEAEGGEVGHGEFGEALGVEGGFEVFGGEGTVVGG